MNTRIYVSSPVTALLRCWLANATIDSRLAAQVSRLRVLFYGYVEAKPHGAFGIIDGNRLSGCRRCGLHTARSSDLP